ncbi:hypothetical protein [Limnoglobus roseus]|uniref:Uncharacterized protein n=1 Tax=Limnoglobus roseus TaxID=2598579 RepID=A0A5C1A961_9BACT|nr:hypothetical protein [Limnoglobus roseus]QEL15899.1 hypothetical protein PX52LOC_02835 [Limnoglobus roseus]
MTDNASSAAHRFIERDQPLSDFGTTVDLPSGIKLPPGCRIIDVHDPARGNEGLHVVWEVRRGSMSIERSAQVYPGFELAAGECPAAVWPPPPWPGDLWPVSDAPASIVAWFRVTAFAGDFTVCPVDIAPDHRVVGWRAKLRAARLLAAAAGVVGRDRIAWPLPADPAIAWGEFLALWDAVLSWAATVAARVGSGEIHVPTHDALGPLPKGSPASAFNALAMQIAAVKGGAFLNSPSRAWAKLLGCSRGVVVKLKLWRQTQERKRAAKPAAPKTVRLTPAIESTETDRRTATERLITEQRLDASQDSQRRSARA